MNFGRAAISSSAALVLLRAKVRRERLGNFKGKREGLVSVLIVVVVITGRKVTWNNFPSRALICLSQITWRTYIEEANRINFSNHQKNNLRLCLARRRRHAAVDGWRQRLDFLNEIDHKLQFMVIPLRKNGISHNFARPQQGERGKQRSHVDGANFLVGNKFK